jgi:carnitine O-acetyltransferase
MFDCERIPFIPEDFSVTYAKPGDTGDSGHIIVFRKNRPWKIEPFQNGRLLSTDELEKLV